MPFPDVDAFFERLLIAVARRWLQDCRRNPVELHEFAAWAGMSPRDVQALLHPAPRPVTPGERVCPVCGGGMGHKARQARTCSLRCQQRRGQARRDAERC